MFEYLMPQLVMPTYPDTLLDQTAQAAVARQIAYISTFTTLVPGDIIVTGTPTGAGARFDPPRFLKPGDEIVVAAEGIGSLRNGVVDG